ncbi:bacterio-opsin activator [Natrarchaeobius halalkaliphilus]|uniref:Bacterio-opsin activator n=1 Tax=Natrarchaeobius halalkaliphilus TaxID=1679091 RepID=A0A3N6LPD6_9EURY|nr:helix-turn-helix domain-containing protein [Natrarchaeobius halalkaliphilus]RQG91308.1 bacterio-opsin activator [Natrarchaeobius halalkaliphilus]
MSLVAEFEARSPRFLLGSTLEAMPSLAVDLERQYALDPKRPIAFCWVRARNRNRLESALDSDRTVNEFERICHREDRTLYRLRQAGSGVQAYRRWVSDGGQLLECRASEGGWVIEMRFPDRESFVRYHTFLEDERVEFELLRLADGTDVVSSHASRTVTESQREALEIAHEYGFFDVPRGTDLATIADHLGISTQAVSERLRRGQARLVENYVC